VIRPFSGECVPSAPAGGDRFLQAAHAAERLHRSSRVSSQWPDAAEFPASRKRELNPARKPHVLSTEGVRGRARRRGMKSVTGIARAAFRYGGVWALATVVALLATSIRLSAQSAPPAQGTVALEGTMKKFYRALNTIVVTTVDGVEHVYQFAKDLVVHGGTGPDAFKGLREGETVVIHYTVDGSEQSAREIDLVGDDGLKITEGTVTRIDRARKQISVRFDNATTETFRLTDRAAAEAAEGGGGAAAGGTKVIIYYSDEAGQKVAHYFRTASK
jgi:hypothetical protein